VLSFLGIERSGAILPPTTSTAALPTATYASKAASARAPAVAATNQSHRSERQFNAAVMSAVYADQSDKRRRERSVVVNGLQPPSSGSDADVFSELCRTQLDLHDVTVSYCRRLGATTTGRIQSLLVVVQSADIASELILRSKLIHPIVNGTPVYINNNLTRAEARAAYEERCRRRQTANRRAARQQLTSDDEPDGAPMQTSQSQPPQLPQRRPSRRQSAVQQPSLPPRADVASSQPSSTTSSRLVWVSTAGNLGSSGFRSTSGLAASTHTVYSGPLLSTLPSVPIPTAPAMQPSGAFMPPGQSGHYTQQSYQLQQPTMQPPTHQLCAEWLSGTMPSMPSAHQFAQQMPTSHPQIYPSFFDPSAPIPYFPVSDAAVSMSTTPVQYAAIIAADPAGGVQGRLGTAAC